ncbi:hypothetical protein [Paenibacillus chungangensis]|uniref:Uncharacterized protein n=1 Tax=Paenibacillus chungangensis TaxID=696535 RepID=A0ABW3HSW5_9BACL
MTERSPMPFVASLMIGLVLLTLIPVIGSLLQARCQISRGHGC